VSGTALELAKAAAKHFYRVNPQWVVSGCSDVSEVISEFLRRRGVRAKTVYGMAKRGGGRPFEHAWMEIEGLEFDPVLWAQGRRLSQFQYHRKAAVRKVFEAGRCALRGDIDEGALEELELMIAAAMR